MSARSNARSPGSRPAWSIPTILIMRATRVMPKPSATGCVADLAPGDAIYMPPMWWHHVRSEGALNVLVNYWFGQRQDRFPFAALMLAMHSIRELPDAEREAWRALVRPLCLRRRRQPRRRPSAAARAGRPRPAIAAARPDDRRLCRRLLPQRRQRLGRFHPHDEREARRLGGQGPMRCEAVEEQHRPGRAFRLNTRQAREPPFGDFETIVALARERCGLASRRNLQPAACSAPASLSGIHAVTATLPHPVPSSRATSLCQAWRCSGKQAMLARTRTIFPDSARALIRSAVSISRGSFASFCSRSPRWASVHTATPQQVRNAAFRARGPGRSARSAAHRDSSVRTAGTARATPGRYVRRYRRPPRGPVPARTAAARR